MKLLLKRKGTFHAHWNSTHRMCGVPTKSYSGRELLSYQYSYECLIEAGTKLDSNGFIIDQLKVDEYFNTKYEKVGPAKSCEIIAQHAVKDIADMLKDNGMKEVYRIAVTVAFNELASMTCEWVKPEAKKNVDEPIAVDFETRSTQPLEKLKVGDRVKVVRKFDTNFYWAVAMDEGIGLIGTIAFISSDDSWATILFDGFNTALNTYGWPLQSLEPVKFEPAEKLKVGDRVRVFKSSPGVPGVYHWTPAMDSAVGEIGTISGTSYTGPDYVFIKFDSGELPGHIWPLTSLERVTTDTAVTPFTTVTPFKKGDRVQVISNDGSFGIGKDRFVGFLGTVQNATFADKFMHVKLDGESSWSFPPSSIRLLSEPRKGDRVRVVKKVGSWVSDMNAAIGKTATIQESFADWSKLKFDENSKLDKWSWNNASFELAPLRRLEHVHEDYAQANDVY